MLCLIGVRYIPKCSDRIGASNITLNHYHRILVFYRKKQNKTKKKQKLFLKQDDKTSTKAQPGMSAAVWVSCGLMLYPVHRGLQLCFLPGYLITFPFPNFVVGMNSINWQTDFTE